MSDIADRFRRVADGFTRTIDAVPDGAWSNPSPCAGWTARDVVGHLVEWVPGPGFLLGAFGIETPPVPSVEADPAGAWRVVRDAVQRGLDDPVASATVADCGPIGELTFAAAVEMTLVADVFVHTWDLATAAGVDPVLDAEELVLQASAVDAIPPFVDEAMRASGHFGPRAEVAADAGPLARVLGFYGRRA